MITLANCNMVVNMKCSNCGRLFETSIPFQPQLNGSDICEDCLSILDPELYSIYKEENIKDLRRHMDWILERALSLPESDSNRKVLMKKYNYFLDSINKKISE